MSDVLGKWQAYGSPITLMTGADIRNKGTGTWMTSGATFLDNSTGLAQIVDIWLRFSTGTTAGSGSPRWDIYIVPVPDGTNAPTPPGTSAGATPDTYFVGSIRANASASFTSGALRGVVLPPGEYLVSAQNNLGFTTPDNDDGIFAAYPYGDKGDPA